MPDAPGARSGRPGPRGPLRPKGSDDPQPSPVADDDQPEGTSPSGSSKASATWDELRRAVGGGEIAEEDAVDGAEEADPELIAEAQRIADEALAEARAAEATAQAAIDVEAGNDAAAAETAEEVDEAEAAVLEDLVKLAAERDDYLDQLRRITADFDNYRKRMLKQQTEHVERAAEGLVEKLLDVLDTFDLALGHGEGFEQVHGRLMGVLGKEGLERIDPLDQPFDPNEADAVAHEDADDGPVVAAVLRAGYRWKGRVIRPAMVKVRG